MRYSIVFAGALATAASASPAFFKRYMVTEYAYVTDVVTVTAGEQAAAPTSTSDVSVAAVPTTSAWGNGGWWSKGWASSSSSTSEAPAPVPTTPTSTYIAPSPTSTYVAPPAPTTTTTKAPAPVTPSTTQEPTTTTPSSSGGTPAYSDIVVLHHNVHRANHSAGDIAWDEDLASTALDIAKSCNYAHNVDMNGGGYGQNIAAGAPSDNISSIITDSFYNNEVIWFTPFFNEATPSDMTDATFDKFGHFTQIVWKGSTKVGCATYDCTGAGNGPNGLGSVADNVPPFFTVCNYGPPGNYIGEFGENVGESLHDKTVNWSYGL